MTNTIRVVLAALAVCVPLLGEQQNLVEVTSIRFLPGPSTGKFRGTVKNRTKQPIDGLRPIVTFLDVFDRIIARESGQTVNLAPGRSANFEVEFTKNYRSASLEFRDGTDERVNHFCKVRECLIVSTMLDVRMDWEFPANELPSEDREN